MSDDAELRSIASARLLKIASMLDHEASQYVPSKKSAWLYEAAVAVRALAAAEQRAQEAFDLMAQERDNFVKAGQQIRADTIEECARVCDDDYAEAPWREANELAIQIRQLAKSERTDRGSS